MQQNKIKVLSTRPLSKELVAFAASSDIRIEESSFIETELIQDEGVSNEIKKQLQQNIIAVFTSMNAVEAVSKHISQKPEWKIYCIGNTTKNLVSKFFKEASILGTAGSANQLAEVIIGDQVKQLIFFCGDQRRDELPLKLKAHEIVVEEVVVYKTIETQTRIDKNYDAILFFSPSAVHSFFAINYVDPQTKLFAIGTTTSAAIELYTPNDVIIADSAGKENLVRQMINYFSKLKKDKIAL